MLFGSIMMTSASHPSKCGTLMKALGSCKSGAESLGHVEGCNESWTCVGGSDGGRERRCNAVSGGARYLDLPTT